MPEYFAIQLRDGTGQVAESFAFPTASEVRGHGDRQARRRRIATVSATMSAVLLISGVAFGVTRRAPAPASLPNAAAASSGPQSTGTTPAATGESVGVRLIPPAQYAAGTANKIELTIDNPGTARPVIVEFKSPQTKSVYWVEPCDNSSNFSCDAAAYADNPLKKPKNFLSSTPGVTAFNLALPAGISTYTAWVDPPAGVSSYTVLVLEGSTVLGQTSSGPISRGFPTLSVVGRSTMTVVRGGSAVEFDTKLTDDTSGSYILLPSFTSLSCMAGQSPVTLPQGSYTLQWYTGASWAAVGEPRMNGQFSYEIKPREATTDRFRLALENSLPADVTSCRVTQVVSSTSTPTPPFYVASDSTAQTAVNFDVK
ncbi:hypothetical protein [Actinospica robiniae]|uniref:hypothetical protein n=1 Tax=Actinospica robiniae TaxID=304901 RepID=UPI000413B457|nr:hypothetical protein [Actinospica robiniae]